MKYTFKKLCIFTTAACFFLIFLSSLLYFSGVRVNTTKSIPIGIYLKSDGEIEKNAYVFFCPPDTEVFSMAKSRDYISGGFCTGGYGYMMKKILAAKNDVVTVNERGVFINGKLLPLSKQIKMDRSGALLPSYSLDNYTLQDNDLLLMSDVSATSFDGRYFGIIDKSQVKDVIRPIFLW